MFARAAVYEQYAVICSICTNQARGGIEKLLGTSQGIGTTYGGTVWRRREWSANSVQLCSSPQCRMERHEHTTVFKCRFHYYSHMVGPTEQETTAIEKGAYD